MSLRTFTVLSLALTLALPMAGQRKNTKAKAKTQTARAETPTANADELMADYRFTEAIRVIERDLQAATKRNDGTAWQLEEQLRQARLGADMLRGTEKVVIVDSVVVDAADFLSAYHLSRGIGTLAPLAQFFPSLAATSVAYCNDFGDRLLFAADGNEGRRQLFAADRLASTWGTPKALSGMLDDDEAVFDYPFLLTDGLTLYFAAQGSESLGGYDIFVTRYNRSDDSYLKAENVGMPFNSPANDYMMVIDEVAQIGWFVSDRRQPAGKVCVYSFIPSTSREVYELSTTNDAEVRRQAQLLSIADSWSDATAVDAARQRIAAVVATGATSAAEEVRYVIDDTHVYTSLSQFRSSKARRLAAEADSRRQQLQALSQQLDSLRQQYAGAATGSAARRSLGDTIRRLEQQYEAAVDELTSVEKQMRSSELAR